VAVSRNLSVKQFARGQRGGIFGSVDTHVCRHGVERWRELTGSVAEEKPEFGGSVTKIHQKMTGLLSGSRAVWVRG
jgi:hypothetical protein